MNTSDVRRTKFSRVVAVVVFVAGVAAATTVVLLFTLGGEQASTDGSSYVADPEQRIELGRSIFASECAICHGRGGEGGSGPALNNGLIDKYPNPAVQESVVANGRDPMRGFSTRLSPAEITAVVLYTRTELPSSSP